jgi:sugar O-acyltransferase (sialic acid O-acetyltransferase NeuD family)
MIIVGAKGFAKEVLQVVSVDNEYTDDSIVFFDDVSTDLPKKLFGRYNILLSIDQAKAYIKSSGKASFVLGLGNPKHRKKLFEKFINIGGEPTTLHSKNSEIGSFDVSVGIGTTIMSGAIISNSVTIGKGCLIYYNSIITHDCVIGDFVEISPNASISGRCIIGNQSSIGTNATILPDVKIGKNVIVGAGTVVLSDVPDNCTIVGVPGKIIQSKK